ncbi:MAG: tetratricopeptide repeat protein [Candidatus Eisenbacteria bacterium]
MTVPRKGLLAAYLALAAPLAAGVFLGRGGAGGAEGAGWSWGFDHLGRVGLAWPVLLGALAVAALFEPVQRRTAEAFELAGDEMERRPLSVPLLLALFALAAFAAFPIATRIYGDSRYILDDYAPGNLAVHARRMLGLGLQARGAPSFVLHEMLARIAGLGIERAYQLVSVACGAVFVLAHARLAAMLPKTARWARIAILAIGLTDGANQLFFGHVENYTVPRLFACLFLIGVVRSLVDRAHAPRRGWTILWLALAIFFHTQQAVLLPVALLWLAPDLRPAGGSAGGSASEPARARRRLAAGIVIALPLAAAVAYAAAGSFCYDYIYSGGRPHPRQIFLPISTACVSPEQPWLRYTLFSGAHVADFLGSLWSINSPAILLVVAVLLPLALRERDDRPWVMLPAIVAAALHDFLLNSAIGYPFDWDLMCVLSPPLLYTAVLLLALHGAAPGARRMGAPLLVLGLATVTLFAVNASRERVHRRVEDMGVWLHRTYYGGSHYRLSSNLSTIADRARQAEERARVLRRLQPHAYREDREVAFLWERLAEMRISLGDPEGALAAYRAAFGTQPSVWGREKPLGYLEMQIGDAARGISLMRDYLAHAPEDGEAWLFLGDAYSYEGDAPAARAAWERFLALDPQAPEAPRVREGLRAPSPSVTPNRTPLPAP